MILRLTQTLNARLGGGPLAVAVSHTNPLLDRSVTGSMNELVAYAEMLLASGGLSVPEVGVRLNLSIGDFLGLFVSESGSEYSGLRVVAAVTRRWKPKVDPARVQVGKVYPKLARYVVSLENRVAAKT